jgi:hypothetical protein
VKQIKVAVAVLTETRLPIVPPVDHMYRNSRKHETSAARHFFVNGDRGIRLTEKRGLSLILG